MAKVGDKYVIEIGDAYENADGKELYCVKGFKSMILDNYALSKLEKIKENKVNATDVDGKPLTKLPESEDFFMFYGKKYICLDVADDERYVYAMCCELTEPVKFDNKTNNWNRSAIAEYLNGKWFKDSGIDENDLESFAPSLFALDGTEYECDERLVNLITLDEYRKYRYPLLKVEAGYWTCTPFSVETRYPYVEFVNSSGYVSDDHADNGYRCAPTLRIKREALISSSRH